MRKGPDSGPWRKHRPARKDCQRRVVGQFGVPTGGYASGLGTRARGALTEGMRQLALRMFRMYHNADGQEGEKALAGEACQELVLHWLGAESSILPHPGKRCPCCLGRLHEDG
jgi:hypothetical protein